MPKVITLHSFRGSAFEAIEPLYSAALADDVDDEYLDQLCTWINSRLRDAYGELYMVQWFTTTVPAGKINSLELADMFVNAANN